MNQRTSAICWSLAVLLPLHATTTGNDIMPTEMATDAPLRILTWNIHGCAAGLEPVLTDLQHHRPDIILLQEAERGTKRTDGADQARMIAERLGMQHASAGSSLAAEPGEQHMAILCRQMLENPLPLDAGTGRIYGLTATVRINGKTIRLICLHLTNGYWQGVRRALTKERASVVEAADLARRTKHWSEPIVLAGDFNALPGMREHDLINPYLHRIPSTQPTYPADKPSLTIDHVYHSDDLKSAWLNVPKSTASDHRPILVELRVGSPAATAPADSRE